MSMRLMFVDIAENLVTNAEYWEFCDATGRDKGKTAGGRPKQPVTNVSWYDAMDYACWKAEQDGIPWRLPLEEELKEAEALIPQDADFSKWPLPELPDVGTHPETTNSLGHNDLVGVVYQWTMRPEDKTKYDKAWEEYVEKRQAAEAEWRSVQPRPQNYVRQSLRGGRPDDSKARAWELSLYVDESRTYAGLRLTADQSTRVNPFTEVVRGNVAHSNFGVVVSLQTQRRMPLRHVGFRLTSTQDLSLDRVEDEDCLSRGSMWDDSECFSQLPFSEKSKGHFRGGALSIRLAFDRETQ